MTEISDDDLLSELGIDLAPAKSIKYTAIEERMISGFEEIIAFYERNKRLPSISYEADIFERLYAVRLEQIRKLPDAIALLAEFDQYNLLTCDMDECVEPVSELDDDNLLSELGIEIEKDDNICVLQNVRSQKERDANDQTAVRKVCLDFSIFKELFLQVEKDLELGARITRPFGKDASIEIGDWFILNGQMVYVAEIGKYFKASNGENDARLRAIYSNGTESNLLMRSLKKVLNDDVSGRRILVANNAGPLFYEGNLGKSGSIYVLRSQSDNPYIKENRNIIHKIGVTTGDVNKRIADASKDATYLLADVEVVAVYTLPEHIIPHKLENLIHKVLQSAQLDITIDDRFGNLVKPKEWFLVSLQVIDEIITHIKNNTLSDVSYDPYKGILVKK
ncbi:GIY-YIG nuclease family protein [Wohlfahrtiimonas chitiniclastica]|uniref:GIY-YIG nuclease family protein n=1 Tax=Wohlfahrtiimonas chitiniclastica TaxID=400946 RepID=A0AB35BZD7_9GAMM|nr:GIY-YIG nuclease family protein [Wohlfahrtiimonas chitiniclastica]MBS7824453.1 GIY-YIG nuclease family protein [Wohlfahrtiimonas chitiniclastica]MBS7840770.1 GIY-YIG nuclease family protein [Wohlfahrtiimonas chitiniclastica]